MGRPLGAYDSEELDRPDLNKCPDCGCFFAGDYCPLCGKLCPEEMRAGNRKAVKHTKRRRQGSGRVTFVDWYYSWWFIVLMTFIFPLVGIILLITSPHSRGKKIAVAAAGVAVWLLVSFGFPIVYMLFGRLYQPEPPVDTDLTRAEYVAACREMSPEEFYRRADSIEGEFVQLTLTVTAVLSNESTGYYARYYLCQAPDGGNFRLLIRDCVQDAPENLMPGDTVTVYGQSAGTTVAYDEASVNYTAPCLNVAYLTVKR